MGIRQWNGFILGPLILILGACGVDQISDPPEKSARRGSFASSTKTSKDGHEGSETDASEQQPTLSKMAQAAHFSISIEHLWSRDSGSPFSFVNARNRAGLSWIHISNQWRGEPIAKEISFLPSGVEYWNLTDKKTFWPNDHGGSAEIEIPNDIILNEVISFRFHLIEDGQVFDNNLVDYPVLIQLTDREVEFLVKNSELRKKIYFKSSEGHNETDCEVVFVIKKYDVI